MLKFFLCVCVCVCVCVKRERERERERGIFVIFRKLKRLKRGDRERVPNFKRN